MHRQVPSIPAPGCCVDRPLADPAAGAGDPARAVSLLLPEDSRTDPEPEGDRIDILARALLEAADEAMYQVKRSGGRAVRIVEVGGSGR
jgi:hypothetical protein